jgi:hypothetical protein
MYIHANKRKFLHLKIKQIVSFFSFFNVIFLFVKKSIMVQRTQSNPTLNSSMTILKKMPTTNNQFSPRLFKKPQQSIVTLGRESTSIKLPTLLKRTASTS